jgi:hypothetical protein
MFEAEVIMYVTEIDGFLTESSRPSLSDSSSTNPSLIGGELNPVDNL